MAELTKFSPLPIIPHNLKLIQPTTFSSPNKWKTIHHHSKHDEVDGSRHLWSSLGYIPVAPPDLSAATDKSTCPHFSGDESCGSRLLRKL
jgi:hypothetical protein